jgi:hypothetical protein
VEWSERKVALDEAFSSRPNLRIKYITQGRTMYRQEPPNVPEGLLNARG